MSIARLAQRLKLAAFDRPFLQLSAQVPGTPFSIKHEPKEERLPGMNRWVDRHMIEHAMDAHQEGIPEEQFVADAARGNVGTTAAIGAGLGAMSGGFLAHANPGNRLVRSLAEHTSSAPLTGALIGALVGGGAGLGYHHLTADQRRRAAHEAYMGARLDASRNPRPRTALPQERQDQGSAAASSPILLHTAPSLA